MKQKSNEQYLESVLIGNILSNPETYPVAAEIVRPTDFSIEPAFKIWSAISSNFSSGDNSDLQGKVYLSLKTDSDKAWFFGSTSDLIPMASSVKGFASQVHAAAKMRRLKAELAALAEKTGETGVSCDWILEDVISLYQKETGEADGDVSIDAVMGRFNKIQTANRKRGSVGLRTGFTGLQNDFIVYQPGHLWVIGAWTSVGKSAYMVESICRFFSENESGSVAIFSTEMTEEQNVARILANKTGINANVILSGNMLDNHKVAVDSAKCWLAGKSLKVYTKTRSIEDISSQCRKLKHSGGVNIVWIDFIQNVVKEGFKDQYAMMSQIAKDLQALAHDCRCTIIALSQLPNHAGREDTGILEFKGAGEIAAACDIGVLMKREKKDKSVILFDVRKNRHGKCEQYLLQYANGWTRIVELSKAEL